VSYQPLARKYRPAGFEDLVGQDAVAKALANGIRLGREPHAVIFSGVRGIGKTTAARLYAKALNCEKGPTPQPCGICSSCLAIATCTHEDVMEIDGASNTSVDDVRQLRETVDYSPQRSRFKIYIIDEVHMLSNSAFNALLKTLEEPPPHVVFLFATTELAKIPQTIVGRCQTFYLKKFSVEQIAGRLAHVLNKENIAAEDRVIHEIAKRGNGSMRDALTFLDTAIAVSGGQLTMSKIADLLSCVSSDTLIALLAAMLKRDGHQALTLVDQLDQAGVSFDELIEQLAEMARNAFIVRDFSGDASIMARLSLEDNVAQRLQEVASNAAPLDFNRIFRTLMQCRVELDGSSLDRFVFENYLLEWCLDPGLPDLDTLRKELAGGKSGTGDSPIASKAAPAPESRTAPALSTGGPTPTENLSPSKSAEPRRDLRMAWMSRDQAVTDAPPTVALEAATSNQPRAEAPPAAEPAVVATGVVKDQKILPNEPSSPLETAHPPLELANDSAESTQIAAEPPKLDGASHSMFPNSWRELVDEWQKKKPLQARIFEETYSISFSPEQIVIAVNQDTLAGMKLLNRDIQTKVVLQMRELFGFTGQLTVLNRQDADGLEPSQLSSNAPMESVLDAKRRERDVRRDEIRQELQNSFATKSVLEMFGGRIESIEVTDPS
jgi:DNA polymerase-3 subunit gamma/tau